MSNITSLDQLRQLPVGTKVVFKRGTDGEHTYTRAADDKMAVDSAGYEIGIDAFQRAIEMGSVELADEVEAQVTEFNEQERLEAEVARLRNEKWQITEQHEDFKREVGRIAIDYANENSLCSEVERMLRDMGIEPAPTQVTFTVQVQVTASTTERERVDQSFIRDSLNIDVSMDNDWSDVEVVEDYGNEFTITDWHKG